MKLLRIYKKLIFPGSLEYWEKRYLKDGNSGPGSTGILAEFKAEIINKFVSEKRIKSVVEFGCGDGSLLQLAKYPKYVGLDVSKKAIQLCQKKFKGDSSKSFFLYHPSAFNDNLGIFQGDLTLSLDVIFHLVEDELFELYIHHLFSSAKKYVIIYSSNHDQAGFPHIRHRKFTDYIESRILDATLEQFVRNRYPEKTSSDFYFYKKRRRFIVTNMIVAESGRIR